MNSKIEKLRVWGCDITGAMKRMLNDEDFYIECLETVCVDSNFETLQKALREKDIRTAFDSSHTLKGLFANMGLTPMYNKAVELVEPLRAGRCENLDARLRELLEMNAFLKSVLDA